MNIPMMATLLKPAKCGEAELKLYEVTKEEALVSKLRAAFNPGRPDGSTLPGKYALLKVRGSTMMSDTQMERRTNHEVIRRAHCNVLIGGLGIGMILLPILRKPEVNHVTVVEISGDVISVVYHQLLPHLNGERSKLLVLNEDIFKYRPTGLTFNTIYFDIWPTMCADSLEEIGRLKRKYRKYLNTQDSDAWMGAWIERDLRRMKRSGF